MVEKIDVAFDACDANAEGAMIHVVRLRERNTEGNAVSAEWFPCWKQARDAVTHLHLGFSRFAP